MGPDGNLWFAETNGDQIGVLDPSGADESAALPASPAKFGFTLSVKGATAVAGSSSTITLSLGAGSGGDTLTVSTAHGELTYSGLMLKKEGGVYELLASAGTRAEARAAAVKITAIRPILTEQVLTAGKGKNQHTIGVEIAFRKALDPLLADDMASSSRTDAVKRIAQAVAIQVTYSALQGSARVNLTGEATSGAGGRIVVVAKP